MAAPSQEVAGRCSRAADLLEEHMWEEADILVVWCPQECPGQEHTASQSFEAI